MPGWKDLVLDIIKLTETVKILDNRVEKLTIQTNDIDKRVVRLETLVEVAKYNFQLSEPK
ncbi:MAG: hypothetical protein GY699_06370 [Desulfobacteraceae bacterium]|nr:hypothetical protein [Desulfobacteraceae bacterium]